MQKLAPVATLALLLGAFSSAAARGASFTITKINLVRESVDGTAGRQQLAGHVTVHSSQTWRRTSHNGAPTAKFKAAAGGGCTAVVQVSVRAMATGSSAKARARAVTRVDTTGVIADAARPGGWLRVVELRGGQQARRPQLYGIAITRVAHNRWADVRAFASFAGCTDSQIRTGPAARGLPRLLKTAAIHARIVRT